MENSKGNSRLLPKNSDKYINTYMRSNKKVSLPGNDNKKNKDTQPNYFDTTKGIEFRKSEMQLADHKRLDYIVSTSFKMMDSDEDGFINRRDMWQFLVNVSGSNGLQIPTEAQSNLAFIGADLNGNDNITKEYWRIFVVDYLKDMQKRLEIDT